MAGLQGLGMAFGAYEDTRAKAKEQKYQDELQKQYLDLQNKQLGLQTQQFDLTRRETDSRIATDATTRAMNDQKIAEAKKQAEQDAANQAFEAGLPMPDPDRWAKYTDDQKRAYLETRLLFAQQHGDQELVKSTQQLLTSIPLASERASVTQYNRGARTDLAHANIDLSRAKIADLKFRSGPAFREHVREFNANQANRAAIAGASAGARYQVAELYAAARMQGLNQQQAQQAAIEQYRQESINYRSGVTAGTIDPSVTPPPTYQAPSFGAPVFNITIDPSTGKPAVSAPRVNVKPPPPGRRMDIKKFISTARSTGKDPGSPQARAAMKADGYTDAEIDAALRSSFAPPPPGRVQGGVPSGLQLTAPTLR